MKKMLSVGAAAFLLAACNPATGPGNKEPVNDDPIEQQNYRDDDMDNQNMREDPMNQSENENLNDKANEAPFRSGTDKMRPNHTDDRNEKMAPRSNNTVE